MDDQEISQLDQLLAIADEDDTPMSVKDVEFLEKLSSMRGMTLSPRQASWFDDLVDRHLKGGPAVSDKRTVVTVAESSALEAQKDHELTLAWHAAGLVFALLSYRGHTNYEILQDTHGGQLELIDEVILLAAQEIEAYRKELAPDCKWGAGLPHLYDVWDSVAKAIVDAHPGQGGTLRQKVVRNAIVDAIVVDYLQLSKTK